MSKLIITRKSEQENSQTIGLNGEIFAIPNVGLAVHDGSTQGGLLLKENNASNENILRNGNFLVDQNGNSWQNIPSVGNIEYIADGWYFHRGGNSVANVAVARSLANDLPVAYKSLRVTTTSGGLDSSFSVISQQIKGAQLLDGQTVTISFWAKTPQSRRIAVIIRQDYDSVTGTRETFAGNAVLTNDWKFYSFTVEVPSSDLSYIFGGNSFTGIWIWLEAGSNYDNRTGGIGTQSGQTDIANIKMEIGKSATPFQAASYEDELIKVQRYFEKNFNDIFMSRAGFSDTSTINATAYVPFAVKKASIPNVTINTNYLTSPTLLEIGHNGFNVFATANNVSSIARITDYVADCEILPY
jgi:hypothetical protein